jgi:hypothetical protein
VISAVLGLVAFVALYRFKVPIIPVVSACALVGLLLILLH